ncbi:hypothetical protein EGH22_02510 [Halomicroarcula sp. F28]|uniref:hypothetical protein n=1 Tax=Haloarcula salinisoli TaxID=2487746 RepID=UPI001C72FF0B|nr:hypothetical protein [Halomicroarcula salinisoli]MBX0285185.1 hypothetical protein [Halomicroarcula salinisoli]
MRRRRLLQLTGAILTTATAGCVTTSEDVPATETAETLPPTDTIDSTTGSATGAAGTGVTAPIYALWSAYTAKDYDGIVDAYHPDSPNVPDRSDMSYQGTVTVERTGVISRADGSATVEAEVTIPGEGEDTETQLYDIRRYQGQWQIWSWGRKDEGTRPAAPQAVFESEFDGEATDDDSTGILRITHSGGDTIDAGKLFVRGSGIVDVGGATPSVTSPDTAWASATGDSEVTAGTSITVGVTGDYTVRLVYEEGESSTTLSEFEG